MLQKDIELPLECGSILIEQELMYILGLHTLLDLLLQDLPKLESNDLGG